MVDCSALSHHAFLGIAENRAESYSCYRESAALRAQQLFRLPLTVFISIDESARMRQLIFANGPLSFAGDIDCTKVTQGCETRTAGCESQQVFRTRQIHPSRYFQSR